MKTPSRLNLAWHALGELGPSQPLLFAIYQLGLHSGHYRRQMARVVKQANLPDPAFHFEADFRLPGKQILVETLGAPGLERCLVEADEILNGQVRLFGARPVELQLSPAGPLVDWTAYELGNSPNPTAPNPDESDERQADIKFIWEPARFGWAYILGRAYQVSGDERYPGCFWRFVETFTQTNPPFQGPNWTSAQEVAMRLIAFSFGLYAFGGSVHTTPERCILLARAIATHAQRIPPTLVYGRAQNNNHLLSEAAGLYTAGTVLPGHPQAPTWRKLGWRWFNRGIQTQIDPDGAYSQHSANYHRLMLQLALWVNLLANSQGQPLPEQTVSRLASATDWLLAMVDPSTGQAPNLGPNDGALIQPLSGSPFSDYRPVLQAAGQAFLGGPVFPPGEWDETSHWMSLATSPAEVSRPAAHAPERTPHILQSPDRRSWAYLRIARFHSRPGHADQLHLDLWWRGLNIARDAGTFRYNAPPPWDNALSHSAVHNTLTVNGEEQMRRAGRFLYLRWAQAHQIPSVARQDSVPAQGLCAWHDGYHQFGLRCQRCVTVSDQGEWLVEDSLLPIPGKTSLSREGVLVRLHWLLPDWPWELQGTHLRLQSPYGWLQITITSGAAIETTSLQAGLDRAGQRLAGEGNAQPTWGWFSPTYGEKLPALAFSIQARARFGLVFNTRWCFPVE